MTDEELTRLRKWRGTVKGLVTKLQARLEVVEHLTDQPETIDIAKWLLKQY